MFKGLGQADCLGWGEDSRTKPGASCCLGLTPWNYNAALGTSYDHFVCWSASCATIDQWAGPNGAGNHCCPGMINVQGRCACIQGNVNSQGECVSPTPPGDGTTPDNGTAPAVCVGTIICNVPDMWVYGAALVLLLVAGK